MGLSRRLMGYLLLYNLKVRTFAMLLRFFTYISADTSRLTRYVASRNFLKPELGVHITNYICLHKAVQLKSELQRPARRLCYHPPVFFRHSLITALSSGALLVIS
jgi:hypothetical protein